MTPRPPPAQDTVHLPLVVLVVDDNQDVADSLALLVRMWGHEVFVAYDGPSALQTACDRTPDVLLLDLGMPLLDGLRLARTVRQRPELRASILVAVTGYADQPHQLQCQEAGFDYFLPKPADPEAMEQLLALLAKARKFPHQAAGTTLHGSDTLK